MITLAFSGLGLAKTAARHLESNPDSCFWGAIKYQFSHVQWAGCGYWDMIQPSFMFMVGVSMAYSYLRRQKEGHSYRRMLGHALTRSFILIFLGIFLVSHGPLTNWVFTNVLTQIGLGYTFLFLLWQRTTRTQSIAATTILVSTWLLFICCPGDPETGVKADWAAEHLDGILPLWHKNANVAHSFDTWLLNQLPERAPFTGDEAGQLRKPFTSNRGGYATLNFIPSIATMLFGLMCGELLRSQRAAKKKLQLLAFAGIGGLLSGWLLDALGICPIVKRIWTPAWTLFSTGWCCLILAALYGVIDVFNYRRWIYPLAVAGMNSIALYCMSMLLKPWTTKTLKTPLGDELFLLAGPLNEPFFQATLTGLCFWLVCWWMYRQNIFVKI